MRDVVKAAAALGGAGVALEASALLRLARSTAFALALVAVVVVGSACASPGTAASSSPRSTHAGAATPTPAAHEFVSKRYGFRLTLPASWSGIEAQQPWDGRALQGQGSAAFADFTDSTSDRVFTIGAAPVAARMRLAAWRAQVVRAAPTMCVDPRSATTATLGGEQALTWTTDCGGVHPVKLVAVHGGRGYVGIFEANGSGMHAADLRVFDSIRRSFRFTS